MRNILLSDDCWIWTMSNKMSMKKYIYYADIHKEALGETCWETCKAKAEAKYKKTYFFHRN